MTARIALILFSTLLTDLLGCSAYWPRREPAPADSTARARAVAAADPSAPAHRAAPAVTVPPPAESAPGGDPAATAARGR